MADGFPSIAGNMFVFWCDAVVPCDYLFICRSVLMQWY